MVVSEFIPYFEKSLKKTLSTGLVPQNIEPRAGTINK